MALEPRAAFAAHRTLPGCNRVACADTWLARAIALSAIWARPTLLGIAPALACTGSWVQRTTIRTLSHTLAARPVPSLHRRVLIDAAVAGHRGTGIHGTERLHRRPMARR